MYINCPKCKQKYNVANDILGHKVRCQGCGTEFTVEVENSTAKEAQSQRITNTPVDSDSSDIETGLTNIFWRRIAAVIVDVILLDILGVAICFIADLSYPLTISCLIFAGVWYCLEFKYGRTIGAMLARITRADTWEKESKYYRLLLYFTLTWLPCIILKVVVDFTESETLIFRLYIAMIGWYVILFIGLAVSGGKRGLQDILLKSEHQCIENIPWSGKRKLLIWGCFIIYIVCSVFVGLAATNYDSEPAEEETYYEISEDNTGLPFESLQLATQTVCGCYQEVDVWKDDKGSWSGTSFVVAQIDNKLWLATNSHVLGLKELAKSDDGKDRIPEVHAYSLSVRFASGKTVAVDNFAEQEGFIDLALLEVDASNLVEGKDYLLVPYDSETLPEIGDEVVAVGSPRGLSGTHTFGRISALREFNCGEPFIAIQTDATIDHGNSGGPLFLKKNEGYNWIGVNTFGYGNTGNLGFAIAAFHVMESQWRWFPATRYGAAEAIKKLYNRNAIVE